MMGMVEWCWLAALMQWKDDRRYDFTASDSAPKMALIMAWWLIIQFPRWNEDAHCADLNLRRN